MSQKQAYVLAIDFGGGSIRASVFDLKGKLKGIASSPIAPATPKSAPIGKEFNPQQLWKLASAVIQSSIRKAHVRSGNIVAISATSQREGIALLDGNGKTLYMGPNSDARAFFEGQAIDEAHGPEVYKITAHTPSLIFAPAKLRWFQQQQPALASRIKTILSLDGWLNYQLTGEAFLEAAAANEIGLVDVTTRTYASELLAKLDVPTSLLPKLVRAGSPIGKVTNAAAKATGLRAGTPVIAAGPDTQASLLGMDVVTPEQIGIVAGTTCPVQMVLGKPVVDEKSRTWTGLHLLDIAWVLESTTTDAGAAYAWLLETLFGSISEKVYKEADRLAAKAPAGANSVATFLGPQLSNFGHVGPKMGGVLFPIPLSITGVSRGQLIRAAQENLAFAIKANIEQLEEITARKASAISIAGGMTRSALFCKILVNMLNRDVLITSQTEAASLGAAICAATGIGAYKDLRSAARAIVNRPKVLKPNPLQALEYQEHYNRWRTISGAMDGLTSYL